MLFRSDVARVVPAILQMANFSQQLDRVLSLASQGLDEAHEEAILQGRILNEFRYFCLAQDDVGFQPSLPTGQIVDLASSG